MRDQRWMSSAFLCHPPSYFLREGLSLNPKLVGLAWLVVPWAVDLPVSASQHQDHECTPSRPALHVDFRWSNLTPLGFSASRLPIETFSQPPVLHCMHTIHTHTGCTKCHFFACILYTHTRDTVSVMLLGKLNHINGWDAASVLGKFIGGGDKHISKQCCDLSAGLTHPVISACYSLSSVLT